MHSIFFLQSEISKYKISIYCLYVGKKQTGRKFFKMQNNKKKEEKKFNRMKIPLPLEEEEEEEN